MANKESRIRDMAGIVSKVLHPYVVLAPVVALSACQVSSSPGDWVKWTVAGLLPAYLFPLLYMQARVMIVTHTTESQVPYHSFFREKPGEMCLLTCLFGVPSALVLYLLGSPKSIIAALLGLAVTGLIVAVVNQLYRASFHVAFLSSMVTSLVIIGGAPFLIVGMLLIPLLGFSRYQLGAHTPLQIVVGFVAGLIISVAVFQGIGLLW